MKKIFIIIGITMLCFTSNAQSPYYYYYYNGEKQYLDLDTKHAFLSLKEIGDSIAIEKVGFACKSFKSDRSSRKFFKQQQGKNRYWTEVEFSNTLSNEQYLQKLDSIKDQHSTAIVSPYFKMGHTDKIGLSNFFYVKLKAESDTALLMQMAEQRKCVVVEQDQFMPLWFVLSTTESSEFNAMETANIFYESGHFAAAEPNLMPEKYYLPATPTILSNGDYQIQVNMEVQAALILKL